MSLVDGRLESETERVTCWASRIYLIFDSKGQEYSSINMNYNFHVYNLPWGLER